MKPYYEENGVTIYHGDCREILPSLPKVDLVLTDPPYGVGYPYFILEDTEDGWNASVLPVLQTLTFWYPSAVFMSMRQMQKPPAFKWSLCWNKPGSTRRNALGGFSIWEPIFIYGDGWNVANDAITLPDCANHDKGNTHTCPKPERLLRWLLSLHGGETILDPFMGSGTTLRAAKDLGRKAIGIEIEERYCEIAANRLRQEVLNFEAVA